MAFKNTVLTLLGKTNNSYLFSFDSKSHRSVVKLIVNSYFFWHLDVWGFVIKMMTSNTASEKRQHCRSIPGGQSSSRGDVPQVGGAPPEGMYLRWVGLLQRGTYLRWAGLLQRGRPFRVFFDRLHKTNFQSRISHSIHEHSQERNLWQTVSGKTVIGSQLDGKENVQKDISGRKRFYTLK